MNGTMNNNDTNKLSKKRQDTAQRIIKALGESRGLLTMAARRAGVSYPTVKRYAAEFQSVKDAVQAAKESMADFTEGKLFKKISDGDTACIIFYLKTQCKARGYIEKQEIEHSGSIQRSLEDYTTDELLTIIERGERITKAKNCN